MEGGALPPLPCAHLSEISACCVLCDTCTRCSRVFTATAGVLRCTALGEGRGDKGKEVVARGRKGQQGEGGGDKGKEAVARENITLTQFQCVVVHILYIPCICTLCRDGSIYVHTHSMSVCMCA